MQEPSSENFRWLSDRINSLEASRDRAYLVLSILIGAGIGLAINLIK